MPTLPLIVSNLSDRICTAETVTVQAREAKVVVICEKGLSGEVLVHEKEIMPKIPLGNTTRKIASENSVLKRNCNETISRIMSKLYHYQFLFPTLAIGFVLQIQSRSKLRKQE